MAPPANDRWPFPRLWCPTCHRGAVSLEGLVDHQLTRRHWRPVPPPAGVVDPAGARQLKDAVEAVEARHRKEAHDDTRSV